MTTLERVEKRSREWGFDGCPETLFWNTKCYKVYPPRVTLCNASLDFRGGYTLGIEGGLLIVAFGDVVSH